jgi:F-box protein 9
VTADGSISSNRASASTASTLPCVIVSLIPFHTFLLWWPTPKADVRAGHSENAWVNITHLITYHRYLRFMPNGVVLSLLANEDQSPHDVVRNLKPGLKMKVRLLSCVTSARHRYTMVLINYIQGFSTGTWTLDPSTSTVHVRSLIDPSKPPLPPLPPAPPVPLHVLLPNHPAHHPAHHPAPPPPPGTLRYSFDMELKLRSRPMGRWNRLDFVRYESVDLFQAGERCDVPLKNERSFWFSKVRRYSDDIETEP